MRWVLWVGFCAPLVLLKAFGQIGASWWIVTLPAWLPAAAVVGEFLFMAGGSFVLALFLGGPDERR